MANQRPHIIFFNTDQQRADTIGALGSPFMQTPHLDTLVRKGVSFTHSFGTSPSCVPCRASLFTGYYPHNTNVLANGDWWSPTWIKDLANVGYQCVNIGKMHTIPLNVKGGFHERLIVENKDRDRHLDNPVMAVFDEWDKYLLNKGVRKPSRESYMDQDGFDECLGAFTWPLEEEDHPDIFVGNMALWWLKERKAKSPLFLEIGFPGPHPPYDPVENFLEPYLKKDFPLPEVTDEEIAQQPPPHQDFRNEMIHYASSKNRGPHDAVKWKEKPTQEQLHNLRAHYYANVTMIDKKIGEIIALLDSLGYLENSLIIFASDHGDALGDHGHIEKWMMYDCMVKVPMILWSPGRIEGGHTIDSLVQVMDLGPTILETAGINPPQGWDAKSLYPLIKGEKSEIRDFSFAEGAPLWFYPLMAGPQLEGHQSRDRGDGTGMVTMIRGKQMKLVHYLGQSYGELYDLTKDPAETKNLWTDSNYSDIKRKLIEALLEWRVRSAYTASASAIRE